MDMISAVKRQTAFKRADAVLYALMAALVAALFIYFALSSPKTELTAIEVWVEERASDAVCVCTYEPSSGDFHIQRGWEARVDMHTDAQGLHVTVSGLRDGEGFNTLLIRDGQVRMQDANCSMRKDCTLFQPITHGGQTILCVPHGLSIEGLGGQDAPPSSDDAIDLLLG